MRFWCKSHDEAGSELRRTRRLIFACIIGLIVTGVGLVWTARDVASWIDNRDSEIEIRRVKAAIAHLASVSPGLTLDDVAERVAKGFALTDARITRLPAVSGEIGVALAPGDERQLVWTAPALGRHAREQFAPTRLPLILGSVFVVALLLLRLERLARALDRESRLATDLANTDALTGLRNRLAFDRDLAVRLEQGAPFALACIDLNGFKAVNDSHGHAAGDAVLRGVASKLRRIAGEMDAAFRLGGDEFAVLFADDGRHLGRLAKKIVLAVDDSYQVHRDVEAFVGVCVGVAIAPQDGRTARDLMHGADAALYRAKAAGGSCARFAADEEKPRDSGPAAAAAA